MATTMVPRTGGETGTPKSSCNCGQLSLTYDDPDPERITLCQCYECQRRTGSVYSVQARLPVDQVKQRTNRRHGRFPKPGSRRPSFTPATAWA
jgi:hypothetical protein